MYWTQVLFLLFEVSNTVWTNCLFSEVDIWKDEIARRKNKVKSLIIRLSPLALQL